MAPHENGAPNERTRLLGDAQPILPYRPAKVSTDETTALLDSQLGLKEQALYVSAAGERLPYNDYTTIDWLHDLVKDSVRYRSKHSGKSLRRNVLNAVDSTAGWYVAAVCGVLTACVAFVVDVAEATVNDWKYGFCKRNPFLPAETCCRDVASMGSTPSGSLRQECEAFQQWSSNWWGAFAIYTAFALMFGVIAGSVTLLTKRSLPTTAPGHGDKLLSETQSLSGKTMYMAAGSGIPEIKTHLSGFQIPHFLDLKVLLVKAVGATFAVATGMCLGKEGPYVHIAGCVGYIVASRFKRYRENGRKMRELITAAVASGLSVAFGAPVGGVLFAYEEISSFFPRKVLWRSFVCSAVAAMVLKELNPNGTGKLILFETDYGSSYLAPDYFVFIFLGMAGGLWGGAFCKLNFLWSKWFRGFYIIKNHPVLEVFFVVLVTVLLQYPNPLTRISGDVLIGDLLVDCKKERTHDSWLCVQETDSKNRVPYNLWLAVGCVAKLLLTIITFGVKVPSGIIIPAMDGGSLFGRLLGQWVGNGSPGTYAMVGAGAFLAGVTRMTVSLVVIMVELTGDLEYVLPHMVAILIAKLVADSLSNDGVYDLAQNVLGHPFLDPDHSMRLIQKQNPPPVVRHLIPRRQTVEDTMVEIREDNTVPRAILELKLDQLKERGLMDGGLVLVRNGMLQGYINEEELDFGLAELGKDHSKDARVKLIGEKISRLSIERRDEEDQEGVNPEVLDLTSFVDATPFSAFDAAPLEYALECFTKLGLRRLIITEEGTSKVLGVIIKKRMLAYLESLH